MWPRIATIFGEPIPSYFTMLVIGFSLATFVGARWAMRSNLDREVVIDLGLFSLIAGVAGARILHVLADGYFMDYVHLCTDHTQVVWRITRQECTDVEGIWVAARGICQPAEQDCFAWARFWNGGLTYYGGLIGASAFCIWFLRREKFPILKACDMAGMTIALGLFWGRLGCFLGGCCFGLPRCTRRSSTRRSGASPSRRSCSSWCTRASASTGRCSCSSSRSTRPSASRSSTSAPTTGAGCSASPPRS
jgi:phosphatidylglycerol:prolipoprotein diacylglycerol transferase